jgi:anti-sigma factor RsiW
VITCGFTVAGLAAEMVGACLLTQVPALGGVPQRAASHHERLQDAAVPLEQRAYGGHQAAGEHVQSLLPAISG